MFPPVETAIGAHSAQTQIRISRRSGSDSDLLIQRRTNWRAGNNTMRGSLNTRTKMLIGHIPRQPPAIGWDQPGTTLQDSRNWLDYQRLTSKQLPGVTCSHNKSHNKRFVQSS